MRRSWAVVAAVVIGCTGGGDEPERPPVPTAQVSAHDAQPPRAPADASSPVPELTLPSVSDTAAGPAAEVPPPVVGEAPPSEQRATPDRREIAEVLDKVDLARIEGISARRGSGCGTGRACADIDAGDPEGGTGTRGGRGGGRGGAGRAEGDFVSKGNVSIVPRAERPAAKVAFGAVTGDFTAGLSREEIEKVVRSRRGTITACYRKQLDRDPDLAGSMEVAFTIDEVGVVTDTKIASSTLGRSTVDECVRRQFQRLKFPAKGGATVRYPLTFSPT